jgi:hypothetical protein
MAAARPSLWPFLFDLAVDILASAERLNGFAPSWSFGGGTALMLQIDHRESHDIDIFIDDPQWLPYLNPEPQGYANSRVPDSYMTDGARALKLAYADIGEIDFICCPSILKEAVERHTVRGHETELEKPAEIIAKKVYFRGASFQPRDMFDLAAVIETLGVPYAVEALGQCGRDRCAAALATVERANPKLVQSINAQLMVRDSTRHLIATAQDMSHDILRQTLAQLTAS